VRGRLKFAIALLMLAFTTGYAGAQTLRSGDTVSITVLQDPKLDRTVLIDPSGEIAFPLAGHIRARGLSAEGLERIIKDRLKKNYKDEQVDVTVALAAPKPREPLEDDFKPKIFLTGEVAKPGSYVLPQRINLMQAISLAGGLSPFAAKRRIQVRRKAPGGETIFPFDYRAYEAGGDIEGNIVLQPGDIVIVPERGILE
jgi:polysaccharide export outer membrane protein